MILQNILFFKFVRSNILLESWKADDKTVIEEKIYLYISNLADDCSRFRDFKKISHLCYLKLKNSKL